ncbi:MAG: bacillithiol biosynthesis cysteine-adding enzyme BshC [Vicinamibacterales bacterium]
MTTDSAATDAAAPDSAARVALDIRSLPSTSRLARDYAFDFGRVASFFAGNPAEAADWRDTITRVTTHGAHAAPARRDLAAVLRGQQDRRGAPEAARAAAARLELPGSVAVVTGQQAGLFGGPLYTLFKAISALTLAASAEAAYGVPVVPVFWVDAEDHDWAEVRTCPVVGADDTVVPVTAPDPSGAGARPVGHLVLDASIGGTLDALERALPPTPFTAGLMADLRKAYQPETGFARACAIWIETVLGPRGLVVFESDDAGAKPLVTSLFTAELASAPRTSQLATEAGQALEALGYHAQVQPAADAAALFTLGESRTAIKVSGGHCQAGASAPVELGAFVARVRQAPDLVGPSVLLRPLVQDTLFPTVCYVAGPGELAYLAQLKTVYAAHDLPMPLVHTRASGTFLDSNAARFLSRNNLTFDTLQAQDERALNALLAAQMPAAVDEAAQSAAQTITTVMNALATAVPAIDATLEGAVRSASGRMQDDLKKLQGKILQAAKKKDETLRRQFRHAQAQAFPEGTPQERLIGFVAFLNRVGPGLVDRILTDMPPAVGQHWLVTL